MNSVKKDVVEAEHEEIPRFQVVAAKSGINKPKKLEAPLVLLTNLHKRQPRPELAVLGWGVRAVRLGRH